MEAGSRKIIDGFSLDNILQISALEVKSITFSVNSSNKHGLIDMDEGELVNAQTGDLRGMDAVVEILCWSNPQIELTPLRQTSCVITTSLINILLTASKLIDDRESTESDIFQEAIELAESHFYQKSYETLLPILKANRDNPRGWIWYSRIKSNIDAMAKALAIASTVAPEDALVIEEQNKFEIAKAKLTKKTIRKCFFCWAPLDSGASFCHYCKGHQVICREALEQKNQPATPLFKEAQVRYEKALQNDPDLVSCNYCQSLVHLNLGDLEQALHHLDKVVKLAPDKTQLADQLRTLLDHMASSEEAHKMQPEPVAEIVETPATPLEVKKTILVVEDSPTTRKVITVTLKRNGYEVIEAADGLEALSRISEFKPNLILLDLILPKMDGYKILSIIKGNKEYKDIPVILLTSKNGLINKVKGKMAGSAAYLTKPFDPDQMTLTIEKYI